MKISFKKRSIKIVLVIVILFGGIFFGFKDKTEKFGCEYKYKLMGYKFYLLYPFVKNMDIPDEGTLEAKCYFEFYQGLYEISNLFGKKDANLNNICAYINTKLPLRAWDMCNFYIGIATTYTKRAVVSDPDDVVRLVDSRVKFCERLKNNGFDCLIGVYTGINVAYQNHDGDSKIPIVDNDPFWICKVGIGKENKLQCMRNIVSYIYDFTNGDIDKGVSIIANDLDELFERFELTVTFFSSLAFRREISVIEIQKMCVSYENKEVRQACIEGYANGLTESLKPGTEARAVTEYCLSPLYEFRESGRCLSRGFSDLPYKDQNGECRKWVPAKYSAFCDEVGEGFHLPIDTFLSQ